MCESPHQREKEGGRCLGFRGDFDDGMMFVVTTNMETLYPQINLSLLAIDIFAITNKHNCFSFAVFSINKIFLAIYPASPLLPLTLWRKVLSSAPARQLWHKGCSQGSNTRVLQSQYLLTSKWWKVICLYLLSIALFIMIYFVYELLSVPQRRSHNSQSLPLFLILIQDLWMLGFYKFNTSRLYSSKTQH